jgi:hypothetical protein
MAIDLPYSVLTLHPRDGVQSAIAAKWQRLKR